MLALVVVAVAVACVVVGLLLGLIGSHLLLLPAARRRLEVLAQQLVAEQQIDNATRTTLQAMRDAVHRP